MFQTVCPCPHLRSMTLDRALRAVVGLGCDPGVGRSIVARALRGRFGFTSSSAAQLRDERAVTGRGGVVVDDVVNSDAFDAVRAAGGLLVRIDRPGAGTPASDVTRLDWDVILINDGTVAQLTACAPLLAHLATDGKLWVGSRVRFSAAKILELTR